MKGKREMMTRIDYGFTDWNREKLKIDIEFLPLPPFYVYLLVQLARIVLIAGIIYLIFN